MRKWLAGAGLGLALALSALPAQADVFFFPRYICNDRDQRTTIVERASETPASEDRAVRVAKRRAPPTLRIAEMEVLDVAELEPLPSRATVAKKPPPPVEPPRITLESRTDFRCIGLERGAAGIQRVIAAPPGTRFFGHPYPESWRQDNIQAAGAFNLVATIPALRRVLARRPPPEMPLNEVHDLGRSQLFAARALADMGDTVSAPAIADFLRLDYVQQSTLWGDALDSLLRLSPKEAQAYALEKLATDPKKLSDLLPLLTEPTQAAREALVALGEIALNEEGEPRQSGACDLIAKQVAFGDRALRDALASELYPDIRTQRAVACYTQLQPAVFPGDDVANLDALLYRHRYDELFDLMETNPPEAARAKIRTWLDKRKTDADIAAGPSHRSYSHRTRIEHLVLATLLGDREAWNEVRATIVDPDDGGSAPWLAARLALRFDLPGAVEDAATRLAIGVHRAPASYTTPTAPHRGHLILTEHGEVIETMAERGDPRFVLGLLADDHHATRVAVHALARHRDAAVCAPLTKAVRSGVRYEDVNHAYWAISVLGKDACAKEMLAAMRGHEEAAHRGMALEVLAMYRHRSVPAQLDKDSFGPARLRAELIYADPE